MQSGRKPHPTFATIPPDFNWQLFKKITNNNNIQNEETARNYFRRFAHNNSELRNKYFREKLNIPEDFNENVYVDYLTKHHNVKLTQGTILNDTLYLFYNSQGKNKYPLGPEYYKMYHKIPDTFDEVLYKK